LEQWIFCTLPTSVLDEKLGGQKTLTLQSLLKLIAKESNSVNLKGYFDTFF
jgi:hypothetical protein